MSNVNSEDTGGPSATSGAGDRSMGGSYPVIQSREEATGRGLWAILGTIVVALLLLAPIVWILVEVSRIAGVVDDSAIVWLYASVAVLTVAGLVWFVFRLIRSRRNNTQEY